MFKFRLFFLILFISATGMSQLCINEFLSSNKSGLKDDDKDYSDWIELYNFGEDQIDLKGYCISDDSQTEKWVFPNSIIESGEYLIIYASKKNRKEKSLHTNFEISKKGERLILYDPQGEIIDQTPPTPLSKDVSYARVIDGIGYFERTEKPSPGKSNEKNKTVIFSKTSGFYADSFSLELSAKKGYDIRYTTDCSIPNANSSKYTNPILITNQLSDTSDIGYIKTSTEKNRILNPYQKATVIRAALFKNRKCVSEVYDHTYFISSEVKERYEGIDVVSLVMDPYDLFDHDTGIYAMGRYYAMNAKSGNYYQRGKDWERDASLSYFNEQNDLMFTQNIGVRIHGGKGRKEHQKSFRLYARKKYSAPYINYPIFDNREHHIFKKIVLRSSIGCWTHTLIKDEFISDLCKDLNVDILESRPAIVFLNGNYWGIYSIREAFDENYIASNYGVDKKDVNIVLHGRGKRRTKDKNWGVICGNPKTHEDLYMFLDSNSLSSKSNYEHVASQLDLLSIADYYCIQLFLNNQDWPTNNNKLWSVGDGKWSQLLYDTDATCVKLKTKTLGYLMGYGKVRRQFAPYSIFLFTRLVESEDFVQLLSERMEYIINTTFNEENVETTLNKFIDRYRKYVQENSTRWFTTGSEMKWLREVKQIKTYFRMRPDYIWEQFKEILDVDLQIH